MNENKEKEASFLPQDVTEKELNWVGKAELYLKVHLSHKNENKSHRKTVSYSKYGYYFLIPFFLVFTIFSFLPLLSTFIYSFSEYYYKMGLTAVGPNWNGLENFKTLFTSATIWKYFENTLIIWIFGFIPQIVISLLLAIWFTDARLKLKLQGFFKAVMYMPNLVMASAFGMLFLMLFAENGPINQIIESMGGSTILFNSSVPWSRAIIAFIDWLMWFGNTTILLMSGIMGIDESIFESARLDGSGANRTFWHITLPLLMPIFVYVLITSLIGGIQLFDVVQIYTSGKGGPNYADETIMMYLYKLITTSKNYGMAGAVSVVLFIITSILSLIIFKVLVPNYNAVKQESRAYKKRMRWLKEENTND